MRLVVLLLAPAPAVAGYAFDGAGYLAAASELPAWGLALQRHDAERGEILRCVAYADACEGPLRSLGYVLRRAGELDRDRQLRLVNHYVNRRRYRRDRRATAVSVDPGGQAELRNHWSTLLQFLERGGDCEDYAVAKYFMLRELGVPAEDMRIVVTRERRVRGYHAVLAVRRDDGSVRFLDTDNSISRPQSYRYRYIYALNEQGIWDHDERRRR